MESTRGQLLIAGPGILDPNFWRTVVLVVEHTPAGALGLVLNRPSESAVAEVVPDLAELIDSDLPVMLGGPVGESAVIVLAEFANPASAAILAFDDVGVLGSDPHDEATVADVTAARAYAGHAGWEAGQLEGELERGDWIIEPAQPDDPFSEDPGQLWSAVLTRKGGSYALLARMPADPAMN